MPLKDATNIYKKNTGTHHGTPRTRPLVVLHLDNWLCIITPLPKYRNFSDKSKYNCEFRAWWISVLNFSMLI